MKEILDVGGAGFLMPAVLFTVLLYASRGLFGWQGRRSQHRKEFFELWDPVRSQDDVWLEVAVRHWLGTYLPAHVIRLAISQPDKCQSLMDLSDLWAMLHYDRNSRTVTWRHRRIDTRRKRQAIQVLFIAGYFAAAFSAVWAGLAALQFGHASLRGWGFGTVAVIVAIVAIVWANEGLNLKKAGKFGDEWIARINRSVAPPAKHRQ